MTHKKLGANKSLVEFVGAYDGIHFIQFLFSYKTPVAVFISKYGAEGRHYKTDMKWSRTTTRHINQWLNGNNASELNQDALNIMYEVCESKCN